jgi:uncharacterized protein YndB with AHSA1/START domain
MTKFCLERRVNAPVDAVWRAWTTPEGLAKWWWPQLPDTSYDIDARVGGEYRFESKTTAIGARGEFTAVHQPDHLEMTWWWIGDETPEAPDFVSLDIRPDGSSTLVTVTHRCQSGDASDDLRQGWDDVLDRLTALTPMD